MRQLSHGMLIVVDGPSGCGKDSLLEKLKIRINRLHFNAYIKSEEDLDTERHQIMEARMKGVGKGGYGDKEMAEELVLHRSHIYRRVFEPIFWNGGTVLANRGEPATLAYQTARGEVDMDYVWYLHRTYKIRVPDL